MALCAAAQRAARALFAADADDVDTRFDIA